MKESRKMKSICTIAFLAFLLKPVTTLCVWAQGSTTYISTLGGPSGGSAPVASNSWFAQGFRTGTNVFGYSLESVSLLMGNPSGNPSGFTVILFDANGLFPGSSVETLSGSLDPVRAGTFSFTPTKPLILPPSTHYFIVVVSSQPLSAGSYRWSYMAPSTNPPINALDGWGTYLEAFSKNGVVWERVGGETISGHFQFSIDVVAIPEPSGIALFTIGAGFFGIRLYRGFYSKRLCNAPTAT